MKLAELFFSYNVLRFPGCFMILLMGRLAIMFPSCFSAVAAPGAESRGRRNVDFAFENSSPMWTEPRDNAFVVFRAMPCRCSRLIHLMPRHVPALPHVLCSFFFHSKVLEEWEWCSRSS